MNDTDVCMFAEFAQWAVSSRGRPLRRLCANQSEHADNNCNFADITQTSG